jgi:hypothetical protein
MADIVDVEGGGRLVGKIAKIDSGSIVMVTNYAGTINIKQAQVTAIATDAPVAIRLASGTRFDGRVSTNAGGGLQIASGDGTITTTVDKIAASWMAGAIDPDMDRHWEYEAAVDVAGKTGNKEQIGTAGSVRATLKTLRDTLQFYAGYDRQVSDGTKSADQLKIGVDYQNNFGRRSSWYVRDEGGFDRVKDVELYNIAAAGMGWDFIKRPEQVLTGRLGLAFRYEGYKDPLTTDVKSAGLDVGINSDLTFGDSKLITRIAWVPTFEDFANYRLTHESYYQIPLANPAWKLRLGMSNDYNSQPPRTVERLDTTYFTRLVLNWR